MNKNFFKRFYIKMFLIINFILIFTFNFSFATSSVSSTYNNINIFNLPDFTDVGGLILDFNKNIVQNLVILLSGVALVIFLFGLVRFIYHRSKGNDADLVKDKKGIFWGLVALFVLVTLWGIIALVQNTLGIYGKNDINIPRICVDGNCDSASSNSPTQNITGGVFGPTTQGGSQNTNDLSTQNDYTITSVSNWSLNIKEGDTGEQVGELQKFLKDKNFAPTLAVDQNFGSNTTNAVKTFQTDSKLLSDGIIGPGSRAVILYRYLGAIPTNGKGYILKWPDLYLGSTGNAVIELQDILKKEGCYDSNATNVSDGNFGTQTENAVAKFQTKNNLTEDKIVGPSTRAILIADDTYSC